MKICSKCHCEKPRTEFNKNKNTKDRLYPHCKPCHRASARKWAADNRERALANMRAYYRAHRESAIANSCAWYQENKERCRVATRARYRRDPTKIKAANKRWADKNKALGLARNRKWVKTHPVENNARVAKKFALKMRAMPKWASHKNIEEFYRMARKLRQETGIEYQVDHVIPIQSPVVCGLHWEGNLQVIPKLANVLKSNRFWPDMPGSNGAY